MPLVFASNEATESGHAYDDRTGVSYEYPRRYRRLIQDGERFLYYRGRRTRSGARQPQVYFGAGVVGAISPSPADADLLICRVLDYLPFATPVPFKDADGTPLEPGGTRRGYYQPGVRRIADPVFERILALAESEPRPASSPKPAYGAPATTEEVDAFAVAVAADLLRRRYPDAAVLPQPHNNPGFDILVRRDDRPLRYVEVKGTQSPRVRFLLSEGEREFAQRHAERYTLLVIHAVELSTGAHRVFEHDGAILDAHFELAPVRWACVARAGDGRPSAPTPD